MALVCVCRVEQGLCFTRSGDNKGKSNFPSLPLEPYLLWRLKTLHSNKDLLSSGGGSAPFLLVFGCRVEQGLCFTRSGHNDKKSKIPFHQLVVVGGGAPNGPCLCLTGSARRALPLAASDGLCQAVKRDVPRKEEF